MFSRLSFSFLLTLTLFFLVLFSVHTPASCTMLKSSPSSFTSLHQESSDDDDDQVFANVASPKDQNKSNTGVGAVVGITLTVIIIFFISIIICCCCCFYGP